MRFRKKEKVLLAQVTALLFTLVAFLTMSSMLNSAKGQEVGDVLKVHAWCVGEDAAKKLTAALATNGSDGYSEIMGDQDVDCFNLRMHAPYFSGSLYVQVTGKVWLVKLPDGRSFQFWHVRDAGTDDGYAWTVIKGKEA